MTCTNTGLTIAGLAVLVFAIWPNLLGATAVMWINIIAGILVIALAWTGTECKWCKPKKKK